MQLMLSLALAEPEELTAWENRIRNHLLRDVDPGEITFVTEPKISAWRSRSPTEQGRLTKGRGRGDGQVGGGRHPSTSKTIRTVPKQIDDAPP